MCNIEILIEKAILYYFRLWIFGDHFGGIFGDQFVHSDYVFLATIFGIFGGIFGDLATSLATAMMKRRGGPATAAASCRSGTKNYTANFGYFRSLPSKFQVSRLEIAACSVEHTHKHTHKQTKSTLSWKWSLTTFDNKNSRPSNLALVSVV